MTDALPSPDRGYFTDAYLATRRAGAAALALTVDTASGTMRQMRVLACFGAVPRTSQPLEAAAPPDRKSPSHVWGRGGRGLRGSVIMECGRGGSNPLSPEGARTVELAPQPDQCVPFPVRSAST